MSRVKLVAFARRYAAVLIALVVGCILSAVLFVAVRNVEQERAQSTFQQRGRQLTGAIEQRLEAHMEMLRLIEALERLATENAAADRGDPVQDLFREMARRSRERHPGIAGFIWIMRVPGESRAGFEAAFSTEGQPFSITDTTPNGSVPAAIRAEYFPAIFTEPDNWGGTVLGADAGSNPAIREALDRARDSGRNAATAPITLPTGRFVYVVRPAYGAVSPLTTVQERRQALYGYLIEAVHIDSVINVAVGGSDGDDVRLRIEDRTGDAGDSLVAVRDPDGGATVTADAALYWSGIMLVAGRRWQIFMAPSSSSLITVREWQGWISLSAGLLVTGLLAAYLWLTIQRAGRISRLATERQREIEVRQRAEATLRERESWFRGVVQNSSDLILVIEQGSRVTYISPSATSILGFAPEQLSATELRRLIHPDDYAAIHELMERVHTVSGSAEPIDVSLLHRDGAWRWVEVVATNLIHEPGVHGVVLNIRDITERKQLEEALTRQAFTDSLTGLPNRPLFMDRVAHTLAAATRRVDRPALVLIDLDGFKVVNDSLGHAAGDTLLTAAAERMAAAIRPGDTVARFGGDEFAVLFERIDSADMGRTLAERLLAALRAPFHLEGREIYISASAGIAHAVTAGAHPAELLRLADIALYRAKSAGKNCVVLFNETMETEAVRRLELETDLRRALERKEFVVYYQPEVEPTSGMITGVEALVRWLHPQRGLISPAEFIPLAEETGVILPLGAWVLRQACAQVQTWRESGFVDDPFALSVNLSGRQLTDADLVAQVRAILEETGLPPHVLRLEITETVLMADGPSSVRTLEGLKNLNVELAIDDFGTGYSSLAYLQRFPVDTVKIDRSFIANGDEDPRARAIVHTVTHLAHVLGMRVTAEGIETEQHVTLVSEAGCDRGQGYFYARPLPVAEVEPLLPGWVRSAA